jgi:PAS domain S-box-containing protein
MIKPELSVLLVEDNDDDADLVMREVGRGFEVRSCKRVQTDDELRNALRAGPWDVVISDYGLPGFDGFAALRTVQASGLDLPFLIVSGTIGEEAAVEALKAGAHDFLAKGRLARLLPAIHRELRERDERAQRRDAEERRREADARYRQIFETSQEGIWVVDREDRTVLMNVRMAEMLGGTPDEFVGSLTSRFTATSWRPTAEGRALIEIKFTGRTDFWASISTSPIMNARGEVEGALAMVSDVTERRKLQAQLMVADRMASLGMLAAGVGHEINNPLSVAFTSLDLVAIAFEKLRSHVVDVPDARELESDLGVAREAILRVRDIVRDLRILSRGGVDSGTRPIDVHATLDAAARLAWSEIRHRAMLFKDYAADSLVLADDGRLGQVFLNLLVNAAHAIPEGNAERHQIRLSTRRQGAMVEVEVGDTGVGMSSEVQRNLFTPFFTTKPVGVGTGLGLSICHRIVTSFGGTITVDSEVGRGTTIRVALPVAEQPALPPPAEPPSAPSTRRGRILIVDDNAMVARSLARALGSAHDVTIAMDPRNAAQWFREGRVFDVVLCDLMMPQMTGMELHRAVTECAPDQAARFVFLTGGAFTPLAARFLEQTQNPKIDKPVDVRQLLNLVSARLGA